MSAETGDTLDTELENVLQQIFMECNDFISTPDSTSDAIPIIRFIKYVQDELPNLSIDNLEELWRCLAAVSTSNRVNLHQFKEATKCWIAKIQQDSNSNAREKLYFVSDADSSMKTMDVDRDIVELELREKLRAVSEENIFLRDELERYQALIDSFKQQCSTTENKLKYYIQKCQEVEKENDEQKVKINELNEKEETMSSALRKYMKENEKLKKKLEAAQIEVHTISSLEEKLEKITKEKMDCMKKLNKMQKEVNEKDESCKQLETMVINFKDTNNNMKESYERDIYELREKNRELVDKNAELLSLSSSSVFLAPQGRFSMSPIPDTNRCNMHSTPYKSEEVPLQDSLYAELKTSGFTFERSGEDDIQALEEELNEYDAAISATLEDLEKVKQFFVTVRGFIDDSSYPQDTNERANKVNELKHKAAFLLHMAEEEITRHDTRRDASTQLRADPANATGSLDQLGVRSFRDLLHAYRSIHTLSSSLTADDSRWRTFGCQNPETDAPFARGDGLTQEDRSEKSTLVAEARSVSDQEDPGRSEENRSCEMPKVPSVPQMDSKATLEKEEEEKTSEGEAKSFQVPEVSSASTPTSPRRKISVYYRSFDVVTVQDQRKDHPGSNLEVRQSPCNPDDSPAQVEGTAAARNVYRNVKSDSDSSNSTPRKFQDSLLDDEPLLVEEPILRKVHLAPTRLKFSHEAGNELARTVEAPDCASSVPVNSTELGISEIPLSPIGEHKEDDDTSVHSASTFTGKCKTEVKSVILGPESCSNKNVSQACSMLNRRLLPCSQADSAKIADSEDPHSWASVRRVDGGSQSPIERSVDSQMSSREDSLAVSGSEPATTGSDDRCGIDEKVAIEVGKAVNVVSSTSLADPVSTRVTSCKNVTESDEKAREQDVKETKQEIKQWLLKMNRSFSEGENLARPKYGCACRLRNPSSTPESCNRRVFPSLTEVRLRESGLANLSDSEESRENLSELELQKKYTAFALCLSIDRLTLPRRIAMSCRQRDQSERNLSCEVRKMQQDIQELAPLCTDRESAERVERVRHQLDMIVRCAHRVSCAAETLGAVHQERRVSRAVQLADKYVHALQSQCEKLTANVAETKRILAKNNIPMEENFGELNDEHSRISRNSILANNRMKEANRRRASVATMSRPMGSMQDVTKEIVRQRNSVSGRMTLRRPSFSSECPKEIEKLNHTETSNNIGELRGIFEQTESRRSSREENNDVLRLSHSNNSQSAINCGIIENEVWTNGKEISPELSDNENINSDRKSITRSSFQVKRRRRRRQLSIWHIMLTSILIFCLILYVIQALSIVSTCHESLNEWLIRGVFDRYRQMRSTAPHPM
ncbi:uncharacterized protein [Temnothorax longispinosus]|uniref:uncharacterized protein isoform X3 n=1 Tax=Temnothorax longispinosus TaxID=300112 RepID=UPI003A98DB8E